MKKLAILNIILLFFLADISAQNPNLINNKAGLAKRYEQAGEFEKAKQLYMELIEQQPWNFAYLNSLNDIYLKLKEYDNSILLIEQKIKHNPNDPNLYGLLGSTYSTMGNNDKAYELWDKGIETNPASMVAYRLITDYAVRNRSFEKAIDILQRGKEAVKDPTIFAYDLANLYSISMEFKKAAGEYCELLLLKPEQIGAVKSRMNRYLNGPGAIDLTSQTVNKYLQKNNKLVLFDLLSYLYMRNKQYPQALEVIIKMDELSKGNGSKILNFARSVFTEKNYNTSAKAYQLLLEKYSSSTFIPDAKIGYLRAQEAMYGEKYKDSSTAWKPYVRIDTSGAFEYISIINSYNAIAKEYTKRNIVATAIFRIGIIKQDVFMDLDSADSLFNELYTSKLSAAIIPSVLERLAKNSLLKNNVANAGKLYEQLGKASQSDPAAKSLAKFMTGKILFWNGKFTEASKKLNEISQNLSDDFTNDAIELSIIINTMKKDSLNLYSYASADLLAEQNKFYEAGEKFDKLAENQNLFLLNDIAKYKLAQMKIALNEYQEAIQVLDELSNSKIKNVYSDKALYLLANTYHYALNDNSKAIGIFQNLLESFPNSLYFDKSREMLNVIKTRTNETI